MELKEAIERKRELETTISRLITEFEKDTTLTVKSVELFHSMNYTGGFSLLPVIVTITAEI